LTKLRPSVWWFTFFGAPCYRTMACVTTNDRAIEHVHTIPVALTFSDHINSFADWGAKYLGGNASIRINCL